MNANIAYIPQFPIHLFHYPCSENLSVPITEALSSYNHGYSGPIMDPQKLAPHVIGQCEIPKDAPTVNYKENLLSTGDERNGIINPDIKLQETLGHLKYNKMVSNKSSNKQLAHDHTEPITL